MTQYQDDGIFRFVRSIWCWTALGLGRWDWGAREDRYWSWELGAGPAGEPVLDCGIFLLFLKLVKKTAGGMSLGGTRVDSGITVALAAIGGVVGV